eukprot:SAG31_NODE_1665_length_7585_cov_6.666711_2_plen_71_part_00
MTVLSSPIAIMMLALGCGCVAAQGAMTYARTHTHARARPHLLRSAGPCSLTVGGRLKHLATACFFKFNLI